MAITKNPRPLLHFGGYTNNQQLPAINTIFQNFCCDAHQLRLSSHALSYQSYYRMGYGIWAKKSPVRINDTELWISSNDKRGGRYFGE
jgi:hypothetical protein